MRLGTKSALWTGVLILGRIGLAQDLPGMGAGILAESKVAHQAVGARDQRTALDHVRQALDLANQIQQRSPDSRPVLVTIARESDTTTTYTPVKRSKDGIMSADRLKKHTSIREVEGEVTNIQLNVTAASEHLQAARSALEKEDWAGADAALIAVSNSVSGTKVEGSLPLRKARENLLLARARVQEDKHHAAVAPLRAAAQAIADFERMAGGHRDEASDIRRQMEDLAGHIGSRKADAAERINGWLETVDRWMQAVP